MKKLYLHIGTEKTGSTTIQEALFQNRSLLSDYGIHFLQSAGERNNRALPSYCMDDEHFDDFFSDRGINTLEKKNEFKSSFLTNFEKEVLNLPESIHSVVISSEHFHSRTISDTEVKRVFDLFSQYFSEIKVICYVREQASACVSLYSTIIKSGGSPNINALFKACHSGNVYYNHYKMLKKWSENFGSGALVIKPFERKYFVNHELLDDFFTNINKDILHLINKNFPSLNESLTTTGQLIGRAINLALPKYLGDGSVNQKRVNATNELYLNFKGNGQGLSKKQYDAIFDIFKESNINLNREFMKQSSSDNPFTYTPPISENLSAILDEGDIEKLVKIFKATDLNSYYLTDSYAEIFRDLAIEHENMNSKLAYKLIHLAGQIRPNRPFIKEKISIITKKVNNEIDIEGEKSYILSDKDRLAYYLKGDIYTSNKKIPTPPKLNIDRVFLFNKKTYTSDKNKYLEDLRQVIDLFPDDIAIPVQCGDAMRKCNESVFIKAREVSDEKSILLKLNSKRHWTDYKNVKQHDTPWEVKSNDVVWRGGNTGFGSGQQRLQFVRKYYSVFNVGFSDIINNLRKKNLAKVEYDDVCSDFLVEKLTIREQLKYKFIVSLEGNDVSTGLKWIMNSNSVPIMKPPTKETWMMEGLLEPYVHYLPLDDDMNNLQDLIEWGKGNPTHCMKIAKNGQVFMSQFYDDSRELNLQRLIVMNYLIKK